MYAVIKTGGNQFRITPSMVIKIDKISAKPGDEITFSDVLLYADDNQVLVGQPVLEKVQVKGKVLREDRRKKIIVFKRRPKKGYKRKLGHRQWFTEVKIEEIKVLE